LKSYLKFGIISIVTVLLVSGCVNKDPESYYQDGLDKYNLADYTGAIVSFDSAIQLNPENSKYWIMKGKSLYNLERYEEAVDCYNYVITVIEDEYNKDAWAGKAEALRHIDGKEVEAEVCEARAK